MKPILLTTKEVAEILKCSTHHVSKLRRKGCFQGYKVIKSWLYMKDDIENYIKNKEERDSYNE